jgi:hypothetical protein
MHSVHNVTVSGKSNLKTGENQIEILKDWNLQALRKVIAQQQNFEMIGKIPLKFCR